MDISPFDAARIKAIKTYSGLEYQLALLLRFIIQVDAATAWAIFYQISATRAKYAIIGNTLEIKNGVTYKQPWKKIESWLTPVDTVRNHLVHWVDTEVVNVMLDANDQLVDVDSTPVLTNAVHRFSDKRMVNSYDITSIEKFIVDAERMTHIVNRFGLTIQEPDRWPWTDIFQQPIVHPTPAEFLQHLSDAAPGLRPQSFET